MKRWHWITLAILFAASVVAGFLGHYEPGHGHWWDAIPAFYAIYGLAGSAALIYLSWLLGKKVLQRGEDYYEALEDRTPGEEE